ncbi:CGG triplet repeat-binding protein 1 isoform X1 [Erythrolamprus reginae]
MWEPNSALSGSEIVSICIACTSVEAYSHVRKKVHPHLSRVSKNHLVLSSSENLLKAAMERFDVKPPPSRSRSKTALYVTPQDRVTEFGSELYEDGGKLYCSFCNVVLNHVRKSAINDHLKSKTHTKRKGEFEEQSVRKKPRTLTASLQCNSATQTEKPSVVQDFVKMFLEASIPLEKADHPAVRAFLSRHVKNGNSIPKADQLRKIYLSDGFTNQLIKSEEH